MYILYILYTMYILYILLTFRRPQNASSNCPIHNSYWRASQAPIVHAEYIPLLDNPHLQVVILNLNYPVVLGVVAEDSEPRRHLHAESTTLQVLNLARFTS